MATPRTIKRRQDAKEMLGIESAKPIKPKRKRKPLTEDQKEILASAGNNSEAMISESAFKDEYSENKILYKKTVQGAVEIFDGVNIAAGKVTLVPSTRVNEIPKTYSADIFISSWALSESSTEAQKVVSDLKFFGAQKGLLIHQHSSVDHPHADTAAELFINNFVMTKTSSFPYWDDQTVILGDNDPSKALGA